MINVLWRLQELLLTFLCKTSQSVDLVLPLIMEGYWFESYTWPFVAMFIFFGLIFTIGNVLELRKKCKPNHKLCTSRVNRGIPTWAFFLISIKPLIQFPRQQKMETESKHWPKKISILTLLSNRLQQISSWPEWILSLSKADSCALQHPINRVFAGRHCSFHEHASWKSGARRCLTVRHTQRRNWTFGQLWSFQSAISQ